MIAAVVAAVFVAALVLSIAAVTSRNGATPADEGRPPTSGQTITVEGEYVCLPKSGDGPHTMECAFGLRTDDGEHYGIGFEDIIEESTIHPGTDYAIGDQLRVTGTFHEVENSIYDSLGTIEAESIEPLE